MKTRIRRFDVATALAVLTALSPPAFAEQADSASILIYDASGSMWGQLDGGITKVEVAREVIGDFFVSRDSSVPLGVIAYGHNRRGDCSDIEVIADVGITDPSALSARLNRLNPRGMTPITESLSLAASMIPPTAESADIILVTDGLETCEADPCALAAQLAGEGIAIRAHVVGFGLTNEETEAMACVADATGGLLLRPQTGQELADALSQIARAEPAPVVVPEPEPAVSEAFFDIGPRAEAGYTYSIGYRGTAQFSDFAGFTPRGEGMPRGSASFGPIGGSSTAPNNPFTKQAPVEPGEYDLVLFNGQTLVAQQPIEVVAASSGFEPVGTVEPGSRIQVAFRGPEQPSERLVLARPDQPVDDFRSLSWDFALHKNGVFRLTAPAEPGIYELRYLNGAANEVMFSRQFGVGVPFEDADQTSPADLAAQAAAATQAAPGQDAMPMVRATFRTPDNFPQIPLSWDAVPLDPDMSPEAWAPVSDMVIGEGTFEPGRYRVSATGPGETVFSAEVEIYPGQDNDFVIPVAGDEEDRDQALSISGDWRVLAVAPRDAPPGSPNRPVVMAHVALMVNMAGTAYEGLISPTDQMAGPDGPAGNVALDSVTEDEGYLFLRFTLPALSPAPFVLSLAPFGDGYAGTMDSAPNSLPVVFWPTTQDYPSMAAMQDVLYGPASDAASNRSEELDPVVFTCNEPSCVWTDPGSGIGAELPQGWGVTEPVFFAAVGDNLPIENPRMTFRGPDGAELRLNPHQWLNSNGPCIGTADLGALCHWADADGPTRIAASFIAHGLQRGDRTATEPAGACENDICFVRNEEFGIAAQLPRGWMMWQIERVDGALEAQFTNGDSILMLIPSDRWNPENGPCFDSAAGPVCYWAEGDPGARLAAPFIAANLAVDPARAGGAASDERAVAFTLSDGPSHAFLSMQVRLEAGTDGSGAQPGDVLYTMDGGLAALTGPFTIGNSYSFYATADGRDYAARHIPIEFGSGPLPVTLRPIHPFGDVTLQLPGDAIIAGSGGYFPITFEAPATFTGRIALHDAQDRDRAALFEEDAQWLLGVQDQVLPVPEMPGLYEIRLLDADGEMFGGVEFEAVAGEARDDRGNLVIEPDGGGRFANHGPYLAGAEVLVQINRGQDTRGGDRVVVLAGDGDSVLSDHGTWLDDFRASVQMPDAPGRYLLALLDTDSTRFRALTGIDVAAAPEPELRHHNPNPAVTRPYTVTPAGRMAMEDRLAIVGPDGAVVAEAGLYEVITGDMRIPEGRSGPHELQYRAREQVLARAALDVGGPPPLLPSGGSDAPAELTVEGEATPGGTVLVTVRGMIPQRGTVGFIRAGAADRTILETGSSVSPDRPSAEVKVPEKAGPWALRLIDQNLIRVAEILPGAEPAQPTDPDADRNPGAIIPVDLGGRNPEDILRALFNNQSGN